MAADDRPARPGEQVGEEHGAGQKPSLAQADRRRFCEDAGELHPVRRNPCVAREHW